MQENDPKGFPKVSVVVPNYNHAAYLPQRIQSILDQTFQDFELILIDDCSTDESRGLMSAYQSHPKLAHLVFNSENSGSPFIQWKKGLQLAKGEYVWIAESDDWCEPSFLETMVAPLEKDPGLVIAYCQSICIDGQGKIKWASKHSHLEQTLDGPEFVRRHMLKGNAIFNASMAVFRRSATPGEDLFTQYLFCGDWSFWIETALMGKVMISGKVLNYFRKHSGDVSSKASVKGLYFIESTEILQHALKRIETRETLLREVIDKRVRYFLLEEKQFESKEVRKRVIQTLQELDPSVLSKIKKAKALLKLGKLKNRINAGIRQWNFGGRMLL